MLVCYNWALKGQTQNCNLGQNYNDNVHTESIHFDFPK